MGRASGGSTVPGLVEGNVGLARHIARRYRNRGVADDDLAQIALTGLVGAAARFEPDRGVPFAAYAGRCIDGEIKRHFRDRTWSVRLSRGDKEICLRVRPAIEELEQLLGRSPGPDELAVRLGVTPEAAADALQLATAYRATSLDHPATTRHLTEPASVEATVLDRVTIGQLIGQLPSREREVMCLRFYGDLTQDEIAERIGISQMQVSRLIRRSLTQLRDAAASNPGDPSCN